MKIEFPEINVQTSDNFESKNYGFGDPRVIMNILRSKMYSNPIRAICQEVMSNSRDANREAGRADTPIIVHMPNEWDDNVRFEDFGLGITPERMENVFVRYGSSTKRNDNLQTGGFGLGAKTPFAYSDTFSVVTVTDDKDGRHKRTYISYIDETQLGAMSLVQTEKVSEEVSTGTTIVVPVKTNDISKFVENVRRVGEYWKIKPVIKNFGGDFNWEEENVVLCGAQGSNEWYLTNSGEPLVIIDGIPYKIRNSSLYPDGRKDDTHKILSSSVRIHFAVGELSITANREDLDYQPETIEAIKSVGRGIVEEIRKKLNDSVSQAKNLWEASCIWDRTSNQYRHFLIKPQWNGRGLINSISIPYSSRDKKTGLRVNWGNHINVRVFEYDSIAKKVVSSKHYRSLRRSITVSEYNKLLEDDWNNDRPNKRRLKTVFEKNPNLNQVAVICFKDKVGKDKFEELYNWSQLGAENLSTFPKAQSVNVVKRGGYTVHKVKRLVAKSNSRSYSDFYEWVPEDTRTAEDDQGGIYVVIRSGKVTLPNGRSISRNDLAELQKLLKQPIYGMLYKWRKKISDSWTDAFEYAAEEVEALESSSVIMDYMRYGFADNALEFFGKSMFKHLDRKYKRANFLSEWIRVTKFVLEHRAKFTRMQKIKRLLVQKTVDPNDAAMAAIKRKVLKSYPLIGPAITGVKFDYSKSKNEKSVANSIVDYIEKV